MTMRIGIDLGGTKIEGIVLDEEQVVAGRRIATPRGAYEPILTAIAELIIELEQVAGTNCQVGIGTPGSIGPDGLLRNSNTTELNGRPLSEDLERMCKRPLKFANDANCMALSESRDGAARRASSVFGVIIGTGTGGGLVVNNELLIGHNAIAGEWGHNPLPWITAEELAQQRPCYCGKVNCIETFLSGPGLSWNYEKLSSERLTAENIVAQVAHNPLAQRCLQQYSDQLARSLASVINIVDPEKIVLAGGLSNIDSLYQTLPEQLKHYVFSNSFRTQIVPAMHGDASGVRGAAQLWASHE